ncbi:fasciclin-2 isoform X4 [Cryptotermes secundus]|uniref:fasciclin-2 isoform X4 n=1 Tax=Cryptotermes secundus TaxID=105785 RepID=UPI000CD7B0A6|nr:fasciclin-2 isoform X4 [Cryptotermes secundus]
MGKFSRGAVLLTSCLFAAITELVLGTPELKILPSQPTLNRAIHHSMLLSCRVDVENKDLVTNLQWHDPTGRVIGDNSDRYSVEAGMHTERMPDGLALIIPMLQERHAGNYTCTAKYANTEELSKSVLIKTFVAITWEDAPEEQYPIVSSNYKIKCKVTANPAPIVDWLQNGEPIQIGGRYIVETDGLLIVKATEADDGTYTCRAIVIDTGELSERNIRVVVHTPPTFDKMESSVRVVETETASVTCKASGKPPPTFSWIRLPTQEDLATADRFSVDKYTGTLTIRDVSKDDDGDYKCVATNAANSVEHVVRISVTLKPRIVAYKNISIATDKEARLSCSASGRPMPKVTFRKLTSPDRFVIGVQRDERIVVENTQNTERGETVGTLIISNILRTDDGLYECIATNEGGEAFRNVHLTVEFMPSFANTPMQEAWSWDNNPVNITCLAESIPNATISWRMNTVEINEKNNDINIRKFGEGPLSSLQITPIGQKYYARYTCRAVNQHGSSEHVIVLKEAKRPSHILQAKLEVITATTITFSFIGPADNGGLPTRKYAVQYKEERKDWKDAKNKTWPVDSPYILEGLEPQTTYNFRFAAQNDVGFGDWAASEHHTMPKRSYPEEPRILSNPREDGVVMSPYSDHYELTWRIPADNGEPIDMYSIKYCPVTQGEGFWKAMEYQCETRELSSAEHTTYKLGNLIADTYYKIELRARNKIGFSTPGEVIIKTARDPSNTGGDTPVPANEGPALSSGAIVSIVVASLFVILIFIDLSCYLVNRTGLLMVICEKVRGSKASDEDAKLGSLYSWRFPLPYCSNKDSSGPDLSMEKLPETKVSIIKKETSVDFDMKKSISRTSFVGKDSAV